jgi:hypothetical protein
MMGNVRDFIYSAIEGVLIRVRRFRESGQLPNELKRRRSNFIIRRRRFKIMQDFDISAHDPRSTISYQRSTTSRCRCFLVR